MDEIDSSMFDSYHGRPKLIYVIDNFIHVPHDSQYRNYHQFKWRNRDRFKALQ